MICRCSRPGSWALPSVPACRSRRCAYVLARGERRHARALRPTPAPSPHTTPTPYLLNWDTYYVVHVGYRNLLRAYICGHRTSCCTECNAVPRARPSALTSLSRRASLIVVWSTMPAPCHSTCPMYPTTCRSAIARSCLRSSSQGWSLPHIVRVAPPRVRCWCGAHAGPTITWSFWRAY